MSQAYRTSPDEERYQSALALFQEKASRLKPLAWVYSRRRARSRAGLVASLLLFVGYPASLCALLLGFISADALPVAASSWLLPGALLLALAPVIAYHATYRAILRQKTSSLDDLFAAPPRRGSLDESLAELQRLAPLNALRERCAEIAPASIRWSFGATSAFTTQLPCLLILSTLSLLSRLYAAPTAGSWQDALASALFMSGLLFIGFYPLLFSRWFTMSDADERAGFSPLELDQPPMSDEVRPATAFALLLGVISLFSEGLHRGALRPLHLIAFTTGPLLFAFLLHHLEARSIQRRTREFFQEHDALFKSQS